MTLSCTVCGSLDLEIVSQSYTYESAYERYECLHCGATGSLTHDSTTRQTNLRGIDGGNGEVIR